MLVRPSVTSVTTSPWSPWTSTATVSTSVKMAFPDFLHFFRTVTHIAICGLKYVGFEADWSLHLGHITGKMARKLSVTRKSNGIKEMVILYIYQDFVKLCAVCFFLWVCTCGSASATEARREHQV